MNEEIITTGVGLNENRAEIKTEFNLLTNPEITLAFMRAIESRVGQGWPEIQPKGMYKYTLEYVLSWLKTAPETDYGVILYGWEGGDRYEVLRDGSVKFLASFACPKTLDQAKAFGFPIG